MESTSPVIIQHQTCHSEALSSHEPDLTCVTTAMALEHVYWKRCSVHHRHAATISHSEADGRQFHSPLCCHWLVSKCGCGFSRVHPIFRSEVMKVHFYFVPFISLCILDLYMCDLNLRTFIFLLFDGTLKAAHLT